MKRLQESIEQGLLSLHSNLDNVEGDAKYRIQQDMEDPIAIAASNDPDTMYVDQALKEPDRKEFIWKIVPILSVPVGTKILPAVWAMKRITRIATREVYKWKACLNIHFGKQEHGVNYWDTYSSTLS